jgi:hypothetical protein
VAVNVPSYDKDSFSFGPGVLRVFHLTGGTNGTAPDVTEATDLVDVGGVRSGGTFDVSRTRLDVFQGSPRALATTFVTEETASLTVNGIEWDMTNLSHALGAGTILVEGAGGGVSGISTSLRFGGDLNAKDMAVSLTHVMPAGSTVTVKLWKAQSASDFSVTFGDDLHEIPYTFNAAIVTGGWDNTTLATNERMFSIVLWS